MSYRCRYLMRYFILNDAKSSREHDSNSFRDVFVDESYLKKVVYRDVLKNVKFSAIARVTRHASIYHYNI